MSNNYSKISSFIWNVCDDVLRGLFKPHEYGDVILPFTVLRRLDCVLESHKEEEKDYREVGGGLFFPLIINNFVITNI
ncbi:hypothetical protein EB821_04685 [Candidatus Marinimicrobia bacterium PRS2]|nr:hypothetical protein EB821_04685 [Candidatus Marinimicrobia bacterium PRS2]